MEALDRPPPTANEVRFPLQSASVVVFLKQRGSGEELLYKEQPRAERKKKGGNLAIHLAVKKSPPRFSTAEKRSPERRLRRASLSLVPFKFYGTK